jgi:hypothetical protein
MTAAALVLQHLVSRVFTAGDYSWRDADGPRFFLDGWTQFDSFEYLDIAARGYWHAPGARSTVVFFPLYAVLIRAGSAVVDQPVLVGVVISGIGGVCAAVGLWRWYAVVRPGEAAEPDRRRIVLWVMLLYPFGWFQFAVVYSDAVFVAFVIAAFLAVERDRPLLAGVLGACASATRPTGVVVVAALWVRQLERDGVVAVSWERWSDRTRGRLWRPTLGLDGAAVRQHSWSPLLSLVGIGDVQRVSVGSVRQSVAVDDLADDLPRDRIPHVVQGGAGGEMARLERARRVVVGDRAVRGGGRGGRVRTNGRAAVRMGLCRAGGGTRRDSDGCDGGFQWRGAVHARGLSVRSARR